MEKRRGDIGDRCSGEGASWACKTPTPRETENRSLPQTRGSRTIIEQMPDALLPANLIFPTFLLLLCCSMCSRPLRVCVPALAASSPRRRRRRRRSSSSSSSRQSATRREVGCSAATRAWRIIARPVHSTQVVQRGLWQLGAWPTVQWSRDQATAECMHAQREAGEGRAAAREGAERHVSAAPPTGTRGPRRRGPTGAASRRPDPCRRWLRGAAARPNASGTHACQYVRDRSATRGAAAARAHGRGSSETADAGQSMGAWQSGRERSAAPVPPALPACMKRGTHRTRLDRCPSLQICLLVATTAPASTRCHASSRVRRPLRLAW